MIDELVLEEEHAEAIIEKAIEFDVYTDEMPETKKDKLETAHEIVAYAIDAWVDDGVRPDAEDERLASAAKQIEVIFDLAGVEIDGDGEIIYSDPPELVNGKVENMADGEDGENGDDDEAAFDIDDIIEGYEELTAATKLKKIKALELDPDDDDDYAKLEFIAEFEEENDEPSSRVLDYLNDVLGEEITEGKDGEDDEGEGEDESEEPWEGYDKSPVKEIKDILNEEDRTIEELQYVLEYEESRDKPRNHILATCTKRIAQLEHDSGDGDAEDEKPKRGRRRAEAKDPDDNDDVDNAVAKDDEADERQERRSRRSKKQDVEVDDDDVSELVPAGLAGAFVQSKLHEKRLRAAGLTPPEDFEGDMPDLPEDIDATDHSELSNLMFDFQSALSTATWHTSMAYIASDIYDEISEYLENRALLDSEESNDAKRRADAKTDDTVVAFRGKQKEAYHDYVRFRDLAKTIEGKIKVLSRVGGFKDDDQEASDRSSRAKGSRGAARRRSSD